MKLGKLGELPAQIQTFVQNPSKDKAIELALKALNSDVLPGGYALAYLKWGTPFVATNRHEGAKGTGSPRVQNVFNKRRAAFVASIVVSHLLNNQVIKKNFPQWQVSGGLAVSTAMVAQSFFSALSKARELFDGFDSENGSLSVIGEAITTPRQWLPIAFTAVTALVQLKLATKSTTGKLISVGIGLVEGLMFQAALSLAKPSGHHG